MFQKSIFIKTILLLNIIFLFNSIIFAQDIVPYIRPDIEKKWLSSIDITYKGLISKEIQNRYIGSSLTFGYILTEISQFILRRLLIFGIHSIRMRSRMGKKKQKHCFW